VFLFALGAFLLAAPAFATSDGVGCVNSIPLQINTF
jgi:hypothetical protein